MNDHIANYEQAEAENERGEGAHPHPHPPHGQAGASSSSPQHSEEIQPPPLIVSPYRLRLPQVHLHQQRQKSPSSPAAGASSSSSPMPNSSSPHTMRSFRLYYGANTIGRCTPEHLEPNFISIDNANVALSRLHANITIAPNNDAWIRDLGSTNGTHLSIREGEGITADPQCFYQLCHGMVITLGDLPVLFVDSTIVPDEDVILGGGIENAQGEKTADGHHDHRPSSSSPINRANEDEQGRTTTSEPQRNKLISTSNHAVVASASSVSAPELRLQTDALSLNKQSSRSVVAEGAKQSGPAHASPLPRRESTIGSRNGGKHTAGDATDATANDSDNDATNEQQQQGRPYLEDDSETSLPAPPRVAPVPPSITNPLMSRTTSAHQKALSFMDDEEDFAPPPPNKRLHDQQATNLPGGSEINLIRMQSSNAAASSSSSSLFGKPSVGKSGVVHNAVVHNAPPPPLSAESEDDGYGAMMMRGATTNTVLEPTTTNVTTAATSSASAPMGANSKSSTKVNNKKPSSDADKTPESARKSAPAAKKAPAGKRAREEDQEDSEVDDDESSGNEKSNSTVPGKGKETKPSASKRGARLETPPATASSPNGKKAAAAAPATPAKKGGKKAPAAPPAGKSAPPAPSPEGKKKANNSAADAQRAPTLVEFKNRLPSAYEWPETQKLNACLSGMDTQDRERVANRIRLMGGAVLEEWNDRVTLLVVKDSPSVRTPKFLIAIAKGVMIVTCRFFLDQPAAEGGNLSRLLEFVPDLQHNGSIVPAADIVDAVMYHQQMRSLGFMPSGALSNTMFATAEMPPKIRNIVTDVIVGSGGKVAKNKRDEARAATTGMRFVTLGADDADSLYDAIVTGSSSRFGLS